MGHNISVAEQRQIENEMIFRRMNENVGDDLGALDAMYIADDDIHMIRDENILLMFKCECSDENCENRVALKLSEYQEIHSNRNTFIVKTDHQVDPIEKVMVKKKAYNVVRKNNSTAEPNDTLKSTVIDNGQNIGR